MGLTDLHSASYYGDAAKVERLLKQHPEWVHETDTREYGVRSARVWDRPLRAAVLRRRALASCGPYWPRCCADSDAKSALQLLNAVRQQRRVAAISAELVD